MKLKDAFDYILDKNNALSDFNTYMIGMAYEVNDSFLFVNLTIEDEEIENNMLYTTPMLQVKKLEVQRRRIFTVQRASKAYLLNYL